MLLDLRICNRKYTEYTVQSMKDFRFQNTVEIQRFHKNFGSLYGISSELCSYPSHIAEYSTLVPFHSTK